MVISILQRIRKLATGHTQQSSLLSAGLSLFITYSMVNTLPTLAQEQATSKTALALPRNTTEMEQQLDELSANPKVNFCKGLIMAIIDEKRGPQIIDLSKMNLATDTFLTVANSEELTWNVQLNRYRLVSSLKKSQNRSSELSQFLFDLSLGDSTCSIIVDNGTWSLFLNGEAKPLTTTPAPKGQENKPTLTDWLKNQFNYSGIVVAASSKQILAVRLSGSSEGHDTKAVVIDQSADQFILDPQKGGGAALLNLKESHGAFTLFDILSKNRQREIHVGDKIVFE